MRTWSRPPWPAVGAVWAWTAAWPEYILIDDARHLVPLPEGLDPVQAAPLTDAGPTPYHANPAFPFQSMMSWSMLIVRLR